MHSIPSNENDDAPKTDSRFCVARQRRRGERGRGGEGRGQQRRREETSLAQWREKGEGDGQRV